MNRQIPDRLIRTIEDNTAFCLLSHMDPDGDSLGSQLALGSFLRRIGKSVHLYSPGPFSRPEIMSLQSKFSSRIDESVVSEKPVVIILDCSTLDRVGDLAGDIRDLSPVMVIDHHSSGKPFGDIHYVDTTAPSVTLLVQNVIEEMGYAVDKTEAKWILFGFCTDTGFFRHLSSQQENVFDAIGRLNAAGATPKQIYGMIFGGRPLDARLLLGKLLTRTESILAGRVLITFETLADKQSHGASNRDSDALYQQLQTVEGCEAVVFIREEDEDNVTVGLRSNALIDVGKIAQSYGGGGHKRAAGFSWTGDREEIKRRIVESFSVLLDHDASRL